RHDRRRRAVPVERRGGDAGRRSARAAALRVVAARLLPGAPVAAEWRPAATAAADAERAAPVQARRLGRLLRRARLAPQGDTLLRRRGVPPRPPAAGDVEDATPLQAAAAPPAREATPRRRLFAPRARLIARLLDAREVTQEALAEDAA